MLTLALLSAACAGVYQSTGEQASSVDQVAAASRKKATGPAREWQTIVPGGETICSDGSEYRFFVRPGDPDKLLFYLQGGGGCADRERCDPEMSPSYKRTVPATEKPRNTGIFNFNNPNNPFLNHTIAMVPYCTGDVHLGAIDRVYPPVEAGQAPLTIHHRGRTNVQAVLDWTYAQVRTPSEIFVTGSSAGAIPSPLYAAILADHYPDARIAQLGDGAGGYRGMTETRSNRDMWGVFGYLNDEPGFESEQREEFTYERLYMAAATANPDILFAEYDAAEDRVQKRFLTYSGINEVSLLPGLEANHADIRASAPNFRTYIAGGDSHTVLLKPEFYMYAADGIAIRDWVSDLSLFQPVEDIKCIRCKKDNYAGPAPPPTLATLWNTWEDRESQYVAPFKIFDNLYYVGINWVAAYLLITSDGLILIDSLYGKWVSTLMQNIRKLGFDPRDVKYLVNTHGHFDHAGGSAFFQHNGARIVATEQDWQIMEADPDLAQFYAPIPQRDIVANDGDAIVLGDTRVDLFNTPGHTEGVLTLRYTVRDGAQRHTAITLGGVGLNFSGVERTATYIRSYERLQNLQDGVAVSLPNHAAMARVFERRDALARRTPDAPHPFVDPTGYRQSLEQFLDNAKLKLAAEKDGTADDPMAELTRAISN
jgi:glyoxylase-like metal-dependent hydrolase (beta-lactamase superfamily II)